MFDIYQITNLVNGKTYIGKSEKGVQERWKTHLKDMRRGRNTRLYNSMRKHGSENFSVVSVASAKELSDLDRLERLWVFLMKSNNPLYGYNMTEGGGGGNTFGGRKHRPESVEKMSKSATGRTVSVESKKRISDTLKEKVGENAIAFKHEVSTKEIVDSYLAGKTTRQIASLFGVEKTLVMGRLRSSNTSLRPSPREARIERLIAEGKERLLNPDSKEMARLYIEGYTTEEISSMFELTRIAVRNRLIKEGVTFRHGGKRTKEEWPHKQTQTVSR